MNRRRLINNVIASRNSLHPKGKPEVTHHDQVAEGGCGVIGIASSEQIAARHLLQSLIQMRNRGNGKGGGIAAVGLVPEEFGVTRRILEEDYLLCVAYLNPEVRSDLERTSIEPTFEIDHVRFQSHISDYQRLEGLDLLPPEVVQYFVRVRPEVKANFLAKYQLEGWTDRQVEDEIVYQNSFRLNNKYYASKGETNAFVLSHGKNLLVLKMVGFGDDVVRYYQLEDTHAHVWIGHHRYPTKGRVWHPGGAHPFVGLNEALVHNGDFANYASIAEYLAQRNIYPLYLTDTEVSVLVFDLLHRTYAYPLEYVIEALAPTTERDFTLLPQDKKHIYPVIQKTHMHCSPDGPWFFLIAQSAPNGSKTGVHRLIGITDTSMLRPQVFAIQQSSSEGPAIGFAASEKQAIDAALESLSGEDSRFWSRADKYWNARGGSHTDGGAFIFSVTPNGSDAKGLEGYDSKAKLACTDKFGRLVEVDTRKPNYIPNPNPAAKNKTGFPSLPSRELFKWFCDNIPKWSYDQLIAHLNALTQTDPSRALDVLTLLMDRRYHSGNLRRSSLLTLFDQQLKKWEKGIRNKKSDSFYHLDFDSPYPNLSNLDQTAVINARGYPPEGENSLARYIVDLFERGFRKLIILNARGHRFIGNGMGANSKGVCIDVYGSPGDYLASGLDGAEIHVHGSGQDQLAQIMKSGKLVVHGDVGQTFGYAAKGGEMYILGNAAGRPMINAVGKPRVVINGTCLDYLAESFMAGDPHNGGGFVILNGITVQDNGQILDLESPYPGGNLFSLASGGAIYVRDPNVVLSDEQLNGGQFLPFEDRDWVLLKPYLEENERHFDIPISRLLDGSSPMEVYRKIRPKAVRELQAEEAWVHKQD